MKFYEIDNALDEAITTAEKQIRLKIEIELNGYLQTVFERDIIEANFFSLKEAAGGVSSRGEILIDNSCGFFSNGYLSDYSGQTTGTQVKVSFSLGEGLPYFQRFIFYVDEKGIQIFKGSGRKRFVRLDVRDLSAKLKKIDEARDWNSPAVFTYSVVCDKTQPEKSLLHCIAQRAGLAVTDIDCSTIPVTLPYLKLRKNIWSELSSMASAYRCHLECPVEKPLVFAHSPYQSEPLTDNEYSYTFKGEDIFYLRKIEKAELYRNTIRLKVNMPTVLDRQEIWRYEDEPVFYDENFKGYYPFRHPLVRVIEIAKYDASYMVRTTSEKKRNVVFADQIDTKEEAENRLEYDSGHFFYSHYDVTTKPDGAVITLRKEHDGDLYRAAIYGRPIVIDQNRSCFMKDVEAVETKGTVALNVTSSYFSEYEIINNGLPLMQYEDWVVRELAERLQNRREFTVKSHRALFNARVGAKVIIKTKNEETAGTINAFSFRYKKDKPFVSSFRILAE